jgi:hypothetical protein
LDAGQGSNWEADCERGNVELEDCEDDVEDEGGAWWWPAGAMMSVEPLMAWKYEDRAKVIGRLRTRSDATSGWPALVGSGMTESLLVEHGSYNGVFPASITRSRS